MLHGTGPLDRDENMPGQRLDVFNTIAHHLAAHGVASLRYDKRGCGKSTGDYFAAGQPDFVADAVAWVDWLKAEPRCDGTAMFLLGHSEGCIVAPRVSLQRPELAGLILLCPVLTPIETVLMKQAEHVERELERMVGIKGKLLRLAVRLLGSPVDKQRKLIERLKSTREPALRLGLQRIGARSLRDLMALDMHCLFDDVRCPVLALGGEKDVQCDPADVAKISARHPECEGIVVPDLTHLLRSDERAASIFGYRELLRRPIAPIVLTHIERWLVRRVHGL